MMRGFYVGYFLFYMYLVRTIAGYTSSEEEMCFSAAFTNTSWVQCVSPLMAEIQGEFNVTKMCLSGEAAAMNCLMETMTECFDILVFAGLSPEQAATIDLSFLSVAELVDLTCELYGGKCDDLSQCDGTFEGDVPLVESVQAVVNLCGTSCVQKNKDVCPSLVSFYHTTSLRNFTTNLNGVMTERTRMFTDRHCRNASDFDANCTLDQLQSAEFKSCYDEALRNYPAPTGTMSCPFFKSLHACLENTVASACGDISARLVREAALLMVPKIPTEQCLQSVNAGLRAPISFLLFTIMTCIQAAILSLML